jgi:hypothetical protein
LAVAFKIIYVFEYITKLLRTQTEVIPNHVHPNVRDTEGEAMQRKYKRLNLGGGQIYDRSAVTAVSQELHTTPVKA